MSDSTSPIDELLEGLQAALMARRQAATARIVRVEAALGSYRRAVERQIALEFAAEHQLKAPADVGVSLSRAAQELRDALLELPDLSRLLSPAATDREGAAPPRAGSSASEAPRARAEVALEAGVSGPWPRLRAALALQKLVVIGALSRDRSESVPAGLGEHIEWIDTERDGVHALGNLPQRIRQGRVAALIILDRAVKHKHSEPALAAARDARVPTAFAGQGGRASLERALTQLEEMLAQR